MLTMIVAAVTCSRRSRYQDRMLTVQDIGGGNGSSTSCRVSVFPGCGIQNFQSPKGFGDRRFKDVIPPRDPHSGQPIVAKGLSSPRP